MTVFIIILVLICLLLVLRANEYKNCYDELYYVFQNRGLNHQHAKKKAIQYCILYLFMKAIYWKGFGYFRRYEEFVYDVEHNTFGKSVAEYLLFLLAIMGFGMLIYLFRTLFH